MTTPTKPSKERVVKLNKNHWNHRCHCGEWFTKKGLPVHQGMKHKKLTNEILISGLFGGAG